MNISDLSYFEVGSDTITIHGGVAVSSWVSGISTDESTSASAQVKITNGTLFSDRSWPNDIVHINISASGSDFTGNVEISGLTDANQLIFSKGDSDLNIIINPLNFDPFVLTPTPLEFAPLLTS